MGKKTTALILASASAARQGLLRAAGVSFEVSPARVRELQGRGRTLRETVLENARRKAAPIARRNPDRIVLAADTLIEFAGRLYGKPASRRAAEALLARLAGRTHRLATGVCLRVGRIRVLRCVVTEVTVRALELGRLRRILAADEPTRYAGGYAIRRGRDPLIERIRGSFTNVVGLPMEIVLPMLRRIRTAKNAKRAKDARRGAARAIRACRP